VNNFVAWLNFAWRPENDGQGFHCDDNDPGGNTNYGVTQALWDDYVNRYFVFGTLQDAGKFDLQEVLYQSCWLSNNCEKLPAGVDVMVADMGMVAGSVASAKLLQRVLNVKADGIIGPITLAAAEHQNALISSLLKADDEFYESLKQFRLWGNGWERRAKDCAALALALIQGA